MLREIFGTKRDEVRGGWRKLRSKNFQNLCCSPDIIWAVKFRKMRWPGLVARMGLQELHTTCWLQNLKRRDDSEDLCVDNIRSKTTSKE